MDFMAEFKKLTDEDRLQLKEMLTKVGYKIK